MLFIVCLSTYANGKIMIFRERNSIFRQLFKFDKKTRSLNSLSHSSQNLFEIDTVNFQMILLVAATQEEKKIEFFSLSRTVLIHTK